jgi:hypothetical protein
MVKNKKWDKSNLVILLPTINIFIITSLLVFSIYVSFIEIDLRPIYIPMALLVVSYLIRKLILKYTNEIHLANGYGKLMVLINPGINKPFIIWGLFFVLGILVSILMLTKITTDKINIESIHTIASVFSYVIFLGTMVSSVILIIVFEYSLSKSRITITKVNAGGNAMPLFKLSHQVESYDCSIDHDSKFMFKESTINPANGLPMANSTMDTHGNLYGFNSHDNSLLGINPASGMAMVNSSIDVHGNVFGSSMNHESTHSSHHDAHSNYNIHSHNDHYNSHS